MNASLPTSDDFAKWRSPVRGTENPQILTNPFWQWCVNTEESAYSVNEHFAGPDSMTAGPCWCFQRMGQATVLLPNGGKVWIAGEHEDYYDPDFYIYNDVVVEGDAEHHIYGYPKTDFPPTDFHTATLVDNHIYLIGNLGYPEDRQPGVTQILQLDTETWRATLLQSSGEGPGWLHDHEAALSADGSSITVRGGKIYGNRILENVEDYSLCLFNLVWTKLTDRQWKRWLIEREDGQANDLWRVRTEGWQREHLMTPDREEDEEVTDAQIGLLKSLYRTPPPGGLAIEDEEIYGRRFIMLAGVRVRFDEDMYGVTMTTEGGLPASSTDAILEHLRDTLAQIENTEYRVVEVHPYPNDA